MLKKSRIKNLISENKWIILASIFFIVWKFLLIGVLWNDRQSPPEPDDSYVYVGYINSVKACPQIICNYFGISFSSYTGFLYLSYRIFFGIISKVTGLNPETVFHWSFYFGTMILLPILISFLKTLTKNKNLIAFSLFFLALYNGSGAYHGFFWVVPSFFSFALFLLIFSILYKEIRNWFIYLILLIPFFIHVHPMSIYSVSIFPIFFTINCLFERKIDRLVLKKILFIIFFSILSYAPIYHHLTAKNLNLNPYGIKNTIVKVASNINQINNSSHTDSVSNTDINKTSEPEKVNENIEKKKSEDYSKKPIIFPGFIEIKKGYLDWLFPHLIGIIPFAIFIFLSLRYKNYRLLSLYASLILFMFASSLNSYGYRSLVFIWPITFVFYAFGFWNLGMFIYQKFRSKIIFIPLLIFVISSFASLNVLFSLFWLQNMNKTENLKLKDDYIQYLYNNTGKDDLIMFDSKLLYSYALTTPLLERTIGASDTSQGKYHVFLDSNSENNNPKGDNLDKFFNILSGMLNMEREKKDNGKEERNIGNVFFLEKKLGPVLIYRNKNY